MLHSFLERVVELSQSRHVSEDELFASASDLFSGKAHMWFQTVKSGISDWKSLVILLKSKFLPPDFDDEIWDDIKSRKQGRSEPTVIFIAVMETLFSRLSRPPVDSTKVKFIRRNLLPQYLSQLTLFETDRVEELVKCCEKLENAAFVKCL